MDPDQTVVDFCRAIVANDYIEARCAELAYDEWRKSGAFLATDGEGGAVIGMNVERGDVCVEFTDSRPCVHIPAAEWLEGCGDQQPEGWGEIIA